MKVYICGDKSRTQEFEEAEKFLVLHGYAPVNPLKVIQALPGEMNNSDVTVIMFEIIRVCEVVYLLNDWDKDLFARLEYAQAQRMEKEILNQ